MELDLKRLINSFHSNIYRRFIQRLLVFQLIGLALLALLTAFLKILFLIERSEIQYRAKKKINFAKNEICIIKK